MRAIDQLIDCFMHALTDCPMTHLGSSLLNMHYSVLTTNSEDWYDILVDIHSLADIAKSGPRQKPRWPFQFSE